MLPVLLLLWLWCGYILGFVTLVITTQPGALVAAATVTVDSSSSSSSSPVVDSDSNPITTIDPELYDKAIIHAKIMAINIPNKNDQSTSQQRNNNDQLLQQLQNGNVEALYTIAQSLNNRNAGDDRITSVQLWHALADGPAAHVPSAAALGFSYAEVDKELALRYFVQASRGKDGGDDDDYDENNGPHQASLFNAGRLFLELNNAPSSLAYIRGCANLENDHPAHATQHLTQTCTEAYEMISTQIQSESISPPGIEDAADMFLYSSLQEFPLPNTREFGIWNRGMEYLEMYASMVREGDEVGDISGKKKGQTYLLAAQQELGQLQTYQSSGGDGGKVMMMSELQSYLLVIILGRIQVLMTAMDVDGDDEL